MPRSVVTGLAVTMGKSPIPKIRAWPRWAARFSRVTFYSRLGIKIKLEKYDDNKKDSLRADVDIL